MLFILFNLLISVWSKEVKVETSKGIIVGQERNGYNIFLGIPYSWVHDLFGESYDYPNFSEPFLAYDSNILCPQLSDVMFKGIKQCLTLNIFVPHQIKNTKLPILVWFHGESFWYGDANEYRSPYLVRKGIIFISVNFRLGPYGFLCSNEYVPIGNQAVRDQLAALQWINKHIAAFDGNPNSVTVAGSGYGGSYVDLLLYSRVASQLFDKAIIQSGSIFSFGFFTPSYSKYDLAIAKILLPGIQHRDVIPYLNAQKPYKVLEAASFIKRPLGVCKETKLAVGADMYNSRVPFFLEKVNNTKILVGYNTMEMLNVYAKTNTKDFYEKSGDIIYKAVEKSFHLDKENLTKLADYIKKFYFGNKDYSPETVINLVKAMSDFSVVNGVERSINKYLEAGAEVYKYIFTYTGASKYNYIPGAGAPQQEELKFLLDWRHVLAGPEQEWIRQNMIQLWSNFIKYGDPTPENEPMAWTPLKGEAGPYLNIDVNMTMMNTTVGERTAFWNLLWYNYKNKYVLF